MKVLIACEESQRVCIAFRELGCEAYSCDIQPCSGGFPEYHIQDDVLNYLDFSWDLIIAFPPCTYLTNAGAVRLFNPDHSIKDFERYKKGLAARDFFMKFYNSDCPRVCIENPVPMKIFDLPKCDQIIEPYYFGDPWKKRTCLWLKGIPPLFYTDIVEPLGLWVGSTSRRNPGYKEYFLSSNRDPKIRSKTFPGVSRAMAAQWSLI